jgi:hypothetical protein
VTVANHIEKARKRIKINFNLRKLLYTFECLVQSIGIIFDHRIHPCSSYYVGDCGALFPFE